MNSKNILINFLWKNNFTAHQLCEFSDFLGRRYLNLHLGRNNIFYEVNFHEDQIYFWKENVHESFRITENSFLNPKHSYRRIIFYEQ